MYKKVARCGIAVWINNLKQVRTIQKYGLVYYVSKRMKYVYLYVDQDKLEKTVNNLKHFRFVRRVQVSKYGQLKTNFTVEPEVGNEAGTSNEFNSLSFYQNPSLNNKHEA